MTLQQKALEIAKTQLGVHEVGKDNHGPEVEKYLKSVGLGPGYSWCMAFVYWCYNEASKALAVANPMKKTGGVMMQWHERSSKYGHVHPQPGDIFIMDYGKGLGHTGIVEKCDADKIYTIEGNTNDEGSREGYEVCRRYRNRSKVKGYLRFV